MHFSEAFCVGIMFHWSPSAQEEHRDEDGRKQLC